MESNKPFIVYSEPPKTAKPKPKPSAADKLCFGEKPIKHVQKTKDPNDDDLKIKTVKYDVSCNISRDRLLLGWKQHDLAAKAGLQLNIVNSYEKGTAVHNQGEYQKIRKALDAGLKAKEEEKQKQKQKEKQKEK